MENSRYFSRSWALLTRDKGWIKPLLVMAAASLIPVAGAWGNRGFALEWARLTAWGADAAPKQKNVDVGKCVASGFRAFVVLLGWGVAYGIVTSVFTGLASAFPGYLGDILSVAVSLAIMAISVFYGVVMDIALVRTAIYENIAAGYRMDRVFDLIKRDTAGFFKLCAINLLSSLVLGFVAGILVLAIILPLMPFFIAVVDGYVGYEALTNLAGAIVWVVLIGVVFGYVILFLANMVQMVVINACGLWMRQFNVPAWGRSEDPLPDDPWTPTTSGAAYAAPTQQAQQWTSQPPQDATQAAEPQPFADQSLAATQRVPQPAPQPQAPSAPPREREESLVETIPLVRVAKHPEEAAPSPVTDESEDDELLRDVVAIPLDDEPDVPISTEEDEDNSVDDLYDDFMKVLKQNDRVPGDDED